MPVELLAPARNADIGIAAIDCGADAVYIAGPAFGARAAAGNSVEDIARLCRHAARFGARVFVTFNTIIFEKELQKASFLLSELAGAGIDGFIVQDLAVLRMAREAGLKVPLHASTQCAIRTPEEARFYESLGFSRLVLERQLSLDEIKAIRDAVSCELEFFVHGALCVCYSGNCYLSQALSGRSANRGECIQACRSRYDLADPSGRTLLRNKAVLSLKDYNLKDYMAELADAGICSFKIEGRLKNISYVRNVVREYSLAMDALSLDRASFGRVVKGFAPDSSKTFNRGYTSLFIDGKRGTWAAMDTPKSMGEAVGEVSRLLPDGFEMNLRSGVTLSNGDGFSFATASDIVGFRGDVCQGSRVRCKKVEGLKVGTKVFRNISAEFERTLERMPCERLMNATVSIDKDLTVSALSEDGREVSIGRIPEGETAQDRPRMEAMLREGLGKKSGIWQFSAGSIDAPALPLLPSSRINAMRRSLSEALDGMPCNKKTILYKEPAPKEGHGRADYKANVANSIAEAIYGSARPAFEIEPAEGAELMRTRYCVRHELGLCPRQGKSRSNAPLYLHNNGRSFMLEFDCARCEMTLVMFKK
ncbi:MAG: U32 family peptidase [Bacteroidales bacterium]|nr:U32 family peptidase [Bacteroidales bacterium]